MKKIIRAILTLFVIGAFILSTQVACQKTAAQTSNATSASSPGLILYDQQVTTSGAGPVDSSGHSTTVTVYSRQYYVVNIDGSNSRQIPITPPSGLYTQAGGRLTVDGRTVVFPVSNQSGIQQALYSCAIDGSSLKQVISLQSKTVSPITSTLEGAY